jgi:hypothetical protein
MDNPVLPALSLAVDSSLDKLACPHGLKIFFGGDDVAEVRLNGERHDAATATLAGLNWPRLGPAGFVRSYVVLVHPETGP